MIIGVDVGWTLKGDRTTGNKNVIMPESYRVVKSWVDRGDEIFLISKVNSKQRKEVETWLRDSKFFETTGVKPENLYFCHERRDKKFFVKGLNIQVMVDDRAEVMANLDYNVIKFLLNPEQQEFMDNKHLLFNTKVVTSWNEIERAMA